MNKKLVAAILLTLFLISVPSMASMISAKSESPSSASFAHDKVVEENSTVDDSGRGSDLSSVASASNNISEENPLLDNVTLAFDHLTFQGEWLGFHIGQAPDTYPPPSGEHFQGIARSPRTGIPPVLYVTRSGNKDNPDYYGSIMVVQMNSRPQDGERLRSNRLSKADETLDTEPPSSDKCIKNIPFSDYGHVGGIQMVGDILAVPLEDREDDALPEGKVVFYNCSEPKNPVKLTYELNTPSHKIGVVGITKLPDGYFLLVMSWGDSKDLDFYRSSKKSFFDAGFNFTLVSSISEDYLNDLEADHFWEFGKNSPQSLNFVNQKDGKVFLIGSRNTYPLAPEPNGDDEMYLWEVVDFNATQTPNIIGVRGEVHKMLSCPGDLDTWAYGGLVVQKRIQGNFMASGGAYISPSGELLYYSTSHFNKGPDDTVKMAELRHIYVSRTGTCGPQFRENHLGGPVYVIEPWVMMFQHDHFKGISVMIDFRDQDLDNYNDFPKLDGRLGECAPAKQGFNDAMTSFIWCGPLGSVLRIYDDDNYDPNGNAGYLECPGTGSVVLVHDVRDLPNGVSWLGDEISEPDFNDEATSARIFWKPVHATVDLKPDTLNLKSMGKWITCYIEIPEDLDVWNIDVSTVMLNETVPVSLLDVPAPEPVPTEIGDYDSDGIPDLMVKFDRTLVSELILSEGITHGNVTLTITGWLFDRTQFEGTDTIRVLLPGNVNGDGVVDLSDLTMIGLAWATTPEDSRWNECCDINTRAHTKTKSTRL